MAYVGEKPCIPTGILNEDGLFYRKLGIVSRLQHYTMCKSNDLRIIEQNAYRQGLEEAGLGFQVTRRRAEKACLLRSCLGSACAVACPLSNISLVAKVAYFGSQSLLLALDRLELPCGVPQDLFNPSQLSHCSSPLLLSPAHTSTAAALRQ